ncbi:MAG: efflux RND transporter permease subunit [Proteobacteria bacterium]|nr:efflux RND transporter permease subunit [Pseudomonadota bacterium]
MLVLDVEAPGRSAAEVDEQLAIPLVTAVAGLPGLRRTTAHSREGQTEITLVFEDDPEWNSRRRMAVLTDVSDVQLIDGAVVSLRPVITTVSVVPVEGPPDAESLEAKRRELERVPGVAEVEFVGLSVPKITLRYDPAKLAAFDVAVSDLREALQPPGVGLRRRAHVLEELLDARVGKATLRDVVDATLDVERTRAELDGEAAAWLVVKGTELPEGALPTASMRVDTVTSGVAIAGVLRDAGADSVRWIERDGTTTAWATGSPKVSDLRAKEQGRVRADDVRTWAIDVPPDSACTELLAERIAEEAVWVVPSKATPSVDVRPHRERLAQMGITAQEVSSAVRDARVPIDAGWVIADGQEVPLVLQSAQHSLDDLASTRVGPVTLADVATIEVVHQSPIWRVNGMEAERTIADFPADLDVEMTFGTMSCAMVSVSEQHEDWR